MIYFDNAATTRALDEVADKVKYMLLENFGNPSSQNMAGVNAENEVIKARKIIAASINAESDEIYFTSGGSEADNWALKTAARMYRRRGNHIISTRIEHASVYNPLLFLEEQGFRITFLNVDRQGHVDPEELKQAICPETILVSVMMVNNEIGAIEPIEEIGKIIKKANPDIVFHVDAIQAYGKLKISVKRCKIDLLSVSGHKIHGPKGTGFLYVRDKVKLRPIIYGGGQQRHCRFPAALL